MIEHMLWVVRDEKAVAGEYDVKEMYRDEPNMFSLKVHHGGEFELKPQWCYVNGKVSYIDYCHINLDRDWLEEMVKTCGGYGPDMVFYFHFKVPNLSFEEGLIHVESLRDFDNIVDQVRLGVKMVDIFVEHWISKVLLANLSNEPSEELDIGDDSGYSSLDDTDSTDEEIQSSHPNETLVGNEFEQDTDADPVYNDDEEWDFNHFDGDDCGEAGVEDDGNGLYNEEDDEDWNVNETELGDGGDDRDYEEFRQHVEPEDLTLGSDNDLESDEAIDPLNFDEFDSLSDEDDTQRGQHRMFKTLRKKRRKSESVASFDCPFYLGQCFDKREDFRKLVKEFALKTRRQLFFVKNDNVRVRVVCLGDSIDGNGDEGSLGNSQREKQTKEKESNVVGGGLNRGKKGKAAKLKKPRKKVPKPTCPWVIHCSRSCDKDPFVVKTLVNEHKCLQTRNVGLFTQAYMAKEIVPILESNPSIPLSALQDQLQKSNQVNVNLGKVTRAKMIAQKQLIGDYKQQYGFLREYCEEILRTNPGSTVRIDCEPCDDPNSTTRQFRRIYICYQALKVGYRLCGRDLMGLDGAFMKGPYPGQILSAVGIDANNGIFPVAFALVETETFKSWEWFLELLGEDLGWDATSKVTFMTDRQKGLIPAINKLYPQSEHRFCLRHVHENMKKQWGGVVYKNLVWKAASATHQAKFLRAMEEIKSADSGLHKWLEDIPACHWSRSHFSGRARCDVLLNNLCEVFNKQLVAARDKPVYTCLEHIRCYLQRRIVNVKRVIAKSDGPLTPTATRLFNKIKEEASQYNVWMSANSKYQVNGPWNDQVVVDMNQKSCTCRRWDITGMPCRHVVAVIWDMARHKLGSGIPEKYVDKAYWLDTWKMTYSDNINPIPGRDHWLPSACPTTLTPPKHHTPIGRHKKLTRKTLDESTRCNAEGKISKKGSTTTCGKCGNQGHNQRSCKGQGSKAGTEAGSSSKIERKKKRSGTSVVTTRKKRKQCAVSSQQVTQNAPGNNDE